MGFTLPVASAPLVGPVIPIGEAEVRDLSPTTEAVSNCGSGGGTVIKHPSMSVVTNYAVEWEVGGTTGIGVTIGEGVVPGGINLSSALEGRYATQFDQGIQQTTAWELPAEPDTVVEYTLMWREVWQPGYVEIRLADESVVRANVRYRIGIQSDIVGKRVENCSGGPIATQIYPTTPPQILLSTIEPSPVAATQVTTLATPDECIPPTGLVELWYDTQYQWSGGIWGTPNIADFTVELGTIETSDPDFGEFTLWISPCDFPKHGYTDGAQFWPKTAGTQIPYAPMVVGQIYVVDYIPAHTGLWSLGNNR